MQRYVSYVLRPVSCGGVEENAVWLQAPVVTLLDQLLHCSTSCYIARPVVTLLDQLLHCSTNSSKSNGGFNSSCNLLSVLISRSWSTIFLRIFFSLRGNPAHTYIDVLTARFRFEELRCFEQVKKKKFHNVFCTWL